MEPLEENFALPLEIRTIPNAYLHHSDALYGVFFRVRFA